MRFALPDDGRVRVVGESYRQDSLRKVTRGIKLPRVTGDNWDQSVAIPAVLRPEPTNPYDRNAVKVEISGEHVGYLSSEDAAEYQPALLALEERGKIGTCPGRLMIGPGGDICVYLHLAPAAAISFVVGAPPGTTPLAPEVLTTVTGEEQHQAQLEPLAPNAVHAEQEAVATLGFCTIQRGKYAAQRAIEVSLKGTVVGQLTRAMSARYEALVEGAMTSGCTPICQAVVSRTVDRGIQVQIKLPRV